MPPPPANLRPQAGSSARPTMTPKPTATGKEVVVKSAWLWCCA